MTAARDRGRLRRVAWPRGLWQRGISTQGALTIAPAGHHNVLMIGPPGSGKTV